MKIAANVGGYIFYFLINIKVNFSIRGAINRFQPSNMAIVINLEAFMDSGAVSMNYGDISMVI
jgi:hypothetical protein